MLLSVVCQPLVSSVFSGCVEGYTEGVGVSAFSVAASVLRVKCLKRGKKLWGLWMLRNIMNQGTVCFLTAAF